MTSDEWHTFWLALFLGLVGGLAAFALGNALDLGLGGIVAIAAGLGIAITVPLVASGTRRGRLTASALLAASGGLALSVASGFASSPVAKGAFGLGAVLLF